MNNQTQHPGIVFKNLIIDEDVNLNISKVAEMLGITRVALSRVVNGKSSLTPDLAARIEKVFNVSSSLMLKIQASYNSKMANKKIDSLNLTPYKPSFPA
ncbi:HigA family addiction module antitoxin [Fangia hongkongensis]|uniref:HigA family addiction module antitoxin n=1 Tax=Fangia hongkongensis TaxID=270495 RepID=UPI00035ED0B6|nr:HigA family addiction module antitoxin [Fangia hongkongensis]MBK2124121.1 HigA family addiction module antidote protein [Fangia hongkongensis]